MNFLYGAGEIERLFFDVSQRNSTTNNTIEVEATSIKLVYRITFVPAVLLVALLSLMLSACISLYLIWKYRRSSSYLNWRTVDTLRLLVDAVDGIGNDGVVARMNRVGREELDDWAKKYRVRYIRITDGLKLSNK